MKEEKCILNGSKMLTLLDLSMYVYFMYTVISRATTTKNYIKRYTQENTLNEFNGILKICPSNLKKIGKRKQE